MSTSIGRANEYVASLERLWDLVAELVADVRIDDTHHDYAALVAQMALCRDAQTDELDRRSRPVAFAVTVTQPDGSTQSYDATHATREAAHADAKAHYPDARLIDVAPVEARWSGHSAAFRAEHPWCGWTLAFAHMSDWDTTSFGLERLVGINVLLTTADGTSRPVNITKWQHVDPAYAAFGNANTACERKAGILAHELDTKDYEPLAGALPTFVPYEDIREIVVY